MLPKYRRAGRLPKPVSDLSCQLRARVSVHPWQLVSAPGQRYWFTSTQVSAEIDRWGPVSSREEVTGSIPVSPTSKAPGQRLTKSHRPGAFPSLAKIDAAGMQQPSAASSSYPCTIQFYRRTL